MKWHSKDEVPPLSQSSIDKGNTDGGWSVQLLYRHKSGRISTGKTLIHEAKSWHWYPGEFGDCIHSPEEKDSQDPIIEWAICPTAAQLVQLIEIAERSGPIIVPVF